MFFLIRHFLFVKVVDIYKVRTKSQSKSHKSIYMHRVQNRTNKK